MKRFYKAAGIGEDPDGGGATVLLDKRPVRTPAKSLLTLPTPGLAEAIAAEWTGQGEEIRPPTMPLMSLACTAIDLVAPRRDQVVAEVAEFGETDMICYWAAEPSELTERQRAAWQPLIDWAALALDAPLRVTTSILHAPQPEDAVRSLTRVVEDHDDFALAGLALAVRAAGSLVIGLALSHGRLSPEEAFEAAELDASFQIEKWGKEQEATKRREGVRADLESARRYLGFLRA